MRTRFQVVAGLLLVMGLMDRPGRAQAPQATVTLASAQVVPSAGGPPSLVLAASGPIAYQVVADDPSAPPSPPSRLRLRLYGVAAAGFVPGPLAPFAVSAQAEPATASLLVTIDAVGAAGARPSVGRSPRASQLTIVLH